MYGADSQADNAIDALNAITADQYRDSSWWDDIVSRLPGVDMNASDAASDDATVVVFEDGSRAVHSRSEWKAI